MGKTADKAASTFFQKTFYIVSAAILIVMMVLAWRSGINGDDLFQVDYSEKIVDFYQSGGNDKAALNVEKGKMHYYGGFYELIAGSINRIAGNTDRDLSYHGIRHLLIAIFGFLAIFYTALFTKALAGWRLALLTLVIMAVSPRFLGHSLMNPKDIPFAAGFAIALYYLYKTTQNLPSYCWKNLLVYAIGLGIALGSRAGGLLLIGYAFMFLGLAVLQKEGLKNSFAKLTTYAKPILYLLAATVVGYIIAIITWPAALQNPLGFPYEALTEFSAIGTKIRVLFDGQNIMSDQEPWYYAPLWISKTIPLIVMIGLVGGLVFIKKLSKKYGLAPVIMLFFAALFPLFYIIYKNSPLHDGWRHLTFVYPPMVIIATLFWGELEQMFQKNKTGQKILYLIIALLLIEPFSYIALNSAYPYTYFNPISGGIKANFGKYETDYWGVSCKPAIKWLEKEGILTAGMTDTVTIATTFYYPVSRSLNPSYQKNVKIKYVRFNQRYDEKWDYGIFPSRFFRGPHLQSGHWPNSKAVHIIKANGVALTAIEKNTDQNAYNGLQAVKKRDMDNAIALLNQEVANYPDNELALIGLQNAYLAKGAFDMALETGFKALKIAPENEQATLINGLAYLNKGDIKNAILVFENYIKKESKNATVYYYLGLAYQKNQRVDEALRMALKAIEINPRLRQAYVLASTLYQAKGDMQNASRYSQAAAKLN